MLTVLLVDNNSQVSTSLAQHLVKDGFNVRISLDGREAIKILQSEGFDLVITDIHLQGLEDFAILNWVNINRPEIKVIMTTEGDYRIDSPTAIRMGAVFCLEKPISHAPLLDAVHEVLNETGFSGTISKITLADYLQLCIYTTATRAFEIIKGSHTGMIVVQEGVITYAQCKDLRGEEAFNEILSWAGGRIHEMRLSTLPDANITQESNFLLLEASRLHDENKRDSAMIAEKASRQGLAVDSSALPMETPEDSLPEPLPREAPPPTLLMALTKSLRIQNFGIFDAQDHILGKSEHASQIVNASPAHYLNLGNTLWEDGEGGALKYMIINTPGGQRYLIFCHGIHRVVVGMKSGTRPEDLLKEIARVTAEGLK